MSTSNTATTEGQPLYNSMVGANSIGPITWDDATWILTSSFIIFTMQSGFGLLEAGCVSSKNEVNIMFKNAVDVIFGGLSYWIFGFGFSFGDNEYSNPFCGVGYFLVDTSADNMGILFSTFVFQLSFATTATTIVSGAMAERTKLTAYVIFSFTNTLIYCIPAHWEWAANGFLRQLGCVDIAGSGAVHLVGGVSAIVAAKILGPRLHRYDNGNKPLPLGNPVSALIGMFMLWWGWLAFNCGSTFGISGMKWKLAARSAVTTLNGSMGGGAIGILLSCIVYKKKYDVSYLINAVLGALVSVTGCAVIKPWESLIIGAIGAVITLAFVRILDILRIDDPVGAGAVHGAGGAWGMVSVGLFAGYDPLENTTQGRSGLFHGGGFYLLGVQVLAVVTIVAWSALLSLAMLLILKFTIGIRLSEEEERLGADLVEHMIGHGSLDVHTYHDEINGCRSESPVSVVSEGKRPGDRKQLCNNNKHTDQTQIVSIRRGSLISRLSYQISKKSLRQDKIAPVNGITTESL